MIRLALAAVADGLVLFGVFIISLAVYGMVRMPDIYTKLHAAAKAVYLGVVAILLASLASGDLALILRTALIGALLVVTTTVASHAIARAAWQERAPMAPGSIDESTADAERIRPRRTARE